MRWMGGLVLAGIALAGCESDSQIAEREMREEAAQIAWIGPPRHHEPRATNLLSSVSNPMQLEADGQRFRIIGTITDGPQGLTLLQPEGHAVPLPEGLDPAEIRRGLTSAPGVIGLLVVWRGQDRQRALQPSIQIKPGRAGVFRPYSQGFQPADGELSRLTVHFCRPEPDTHLLTVHITATLSTLREVEAKDPEQKAIHASRSGPKSRYSFSALPGSLTFPVFVRVAYADGQVRDLPVWGEPDPRDATLMRYSALIPGEAKSVSVVQSELAEWRSPPVRITPMPASRTTAPRTGL